MLHTMGCKHALEEDEACNACIHIQRLRFCSLVIVLYCLIFCLYDVVLQANFSFEIRVHEHCIDL